MENGHGNKKLFVISGSSGVGKGTLISGFLERNKDFCLSISYTTRGIREHEQDGVNYFFTTKEKFIAMKKNDEFLESAQFSDNYYGTSKVYVEKCLRDGKNLILEIDTQGALQIKEKVPSAVLIFIAPPSLTDLEFRLRNRKTESEEQINKRLNFVKLELENSQRFDYVIVNDKLDSAIIELERVIKTELSY